MARDEVLDGLPAARRGLYLPLMAQHGFKVGDLVRIGGSASANSSETFMDARVHARPTGIFEVTACLPEVNGEPQYRVKGGDDHSERIVRESQLMRAGGAAQPRR